jgi:Putative peptidoglycan binding domain
MKTFLLLAFSFSIALAHVVNAEDQDKVKAAPKTRSHVQASQHVAPQHVAPQHVTPQHVGPPRTTVSRVPHINQTTVQANQHHPKVQSTARVHTKPIIPNTNAPRTASTVQADANLRNKNWQNKNNQNTLQKKNWQNQNRTSNSWAQARRRHNHEHHDRNWWRSHFTRFALFGSGYYFWDGGYWYPAYGYDSGYDTYAYNEPIYGYNNLDPGQVISSVQTELQRLGYYRYAVDGQMGPATRAAIANYQRDSGLSITSAIDEPTLDSLGLG